MSPALRRAVRVAGASGGFSDRVHAMSRIARNEDVDVIIGDWLSEMTMTIHGSGKQRNLNELKSKSKTFAELSLEEQIATGMFAENFMDCFEPAIDDIARKGIKIAVNAGASDTEVLAKIVREKVKSKGHDLKVAWIEGDEQTETVRRMIGEGETFESLMHGRKIQDWEQEILCAQCYLGGLGIAGEFDLIVANVD